VSGRHKLEAVTFAAVALSLAFLAPADAAAGGNTLYRATLVQAAPGRSVLPFIDDDYGKALAEAKARNLPIFAEAWAPWCHTCRSMQAFVFTDPSLEPRADQFVWLAIDTEKKSNAPFLTKYPVEAWPSFFIIDPKTQTAAIRWVGGATVPQLEKLLDDGIRTLARTPRGAAAALALADRLYGQKKNADAAAAYRAVLAKAPPQWPPYARAVESLLFALHRLDDHAGCATLARDAFVRLASTSSAASVAGSGLDCALSLEKGDPARPALVAALTADAQKVLAAPRLDIAADDISSLYGVLSDEREAARDEPGRQKVLSDWAAFLEKEAGKAKTPEARAVFDSHRLSVYIALGQPQRAIPMLEASEEDFPDDYNPCARLALAYEAMKDYEMALQASDKALSKAYGPRKIGILTARSRIHRELGDSVSARIAMEEAIREAEALPEGQRSETQIAALKKKLAAEPQ
jgi:tetratricopeptide (TPR) repeat protein